MTDVEELLQRLERLLDEVDSLDEEARGKVFELLDGVDALHRSALHRLEEELGPADVARLRGAHPALEWLFDAYGVGMDEAAASVALEPILPYIHSHGGEVKVLAARRGVVRLRMSGSCAGCTASAVTLREGIEEALRENLPGFVAVEVEEDDAEAHPPPGPTLLQIKGPSEA